MERIEITIKGIVKKLIGQIHPLGETHIDTERYENLILMCEIADDLIREISDVAKNASRHEISMKQAGEYALKWVKETADKDNYSCLYSAPPVLLPLRELSLEQKIIVVMVFLGYEFVNDAPDEYPDGYYMHPDYGFALPSYMALHDSWVSIHSVWEKFRELRHKPTKVRIRGHYDKCESIISAISYGTPLEAFTALYEAINWFNSLNKEG